MVVKGILIISNTYVNIVLMHLHSVQTPDLRNGVDSLLYLTNLNLSFSIIWWFITNATNDSEYGQLCYGTLINLTPCCYEKAINVLVYDH